MKWKDIFQQIPAVLYLSQLKWILLLCMLISSHAKDVSVNECDKIECEPDITKESNNECSLYMAESSIPNAGIGVYIAINISKGEAVGSRELMIPIYDKNVYNNLKHYTWNIDEIKDGISTNLSTSLVGIGSMANGHTGLMNVKMGDYEFDDSGLHRSSDEGVGAFTYHHISGWKASVPIMAGMEIFANYGPEWFDSESRSEMLQYLPRRDEYNKVDAILEAMDEIIKMSDRDNLPKDAFEVFWDAYRKDETADMNIRTSSLVPKSVEDLKQAIKVGAAFYNAHDNFIRPVTWLKNNGLCMDNIKEGRSTIHQAGRGAFATRILLKGSFVAPIPLHHICNVVDDDRDFFSHVKSGTGQLLLNYCFGHPSSSHLTLCPYGSMVSLINHSKKANVKIRWSTSKFHKKEWLDLPVYELCKLKDNGLMFDLVATRNILPGEELFLNYGKNWSDAWDAHVENWALKNYSSDYKPASAFNKDDDIRTMEEQKVNPYPDNIRLECLHKVPKDQNNTQDTDQNPTSFQKDNGNKFHECKILKREKGQESYNYTVEIILSDNEHNAILQDVPRKEIRFKDKPYTSDMFLKGVFRHKIMIPDELFPLYWREKLTDL